ncbi:hypothetical protein BDV93DRAFT_402584, partial [Ceratobasidium sp. AG-I]
LTESHTGAYMAEKTLECLARFQLTDKASELTSTIIATVCLDNASNNDTFVRGLAVSLPSFRGPKSRVRCF